MAVYTARGLNRFLPRWLTLACLASVSGVRAFQPSSSVQRRGSTSMENHDAARSASENSLRRVIWLVRLIVRNCTYREVLVVQYASEPL
jgi:hypothetical protein